MKCPFCNAENMDGVDVCEDCQEPLDFMSQPRATSDLETHLLRDRIATIMFLQPAVVRPQQTVRDVLDMLADETTGCVVVAEEDRVVGIFTERDALLRLNTEAAALADRPIAEYMTPSPETISYDAEIAFALHKMDIGGYRHLPVTRDGKLTGVISTRDIFNYIGSHLASVE